MGRQRIWLGAMLLALGATVLLALSSDAGAAPTRAASPSLGGFSYRVEIDGVDAGRFLQVEGISATVEVVEYREGTDNLVRTLPGRFRWGEVSLVREVDASHELFDWIGSARSASANLRRDVTVVQIDAQSKQTVRTYNLVDCIPIHYTTSTVGGGANETLVEALTLAPADVTLGS